VFLRWTNLTLGCGCRDPSDLVSEVDLFCDPMVCGLGFHQILVSEVDRG
jgi:hypothetical protein